MIANPIYPKNHGFFSPPCAQFTAGYSTMACSPCFFSTILLRNYRIMQCLFLLSYISSSGRRSLRHLASIENSLLPGKKSISQPQFNPFRYPIVRIVSSSVEYFKNPPTLSSSFIILQIVLRQRSLASFYEQPIILAIRGQLVIPSSTTKERSFSSSILDQLQFGSDYSACYSFIFRFYSLSIGCSGGTGTSIAFLGQLLSMMFLNLCDRMLSLDIGLGG